MQNQTPVPDHLLPLVKTKIDLPSMHTATVGRESLIERIAATTSRIVLLDASAGWGKTSVLAAWTAREAGHRAFAFVRLGRSDNDTQTFWSYVLAALRTVDHEIAPDADDGLQLAGIDPARSVIPALVNSIRDRSEPLTLILDDYHLITDREVHSSMDFLIEQAPGNLKLVISTRSSPPLALQRYRMSGDVFEVRSGDLRFDVTQTRDLFATRFGIAISAHSAEVLCSKTEGWPAGIQLAALSCSSDPDPAQFIASFSGSNRNVVDYLTSEVLSRTSESTRAFLLATSILDQFNAELCDALLGRTDSAEVLEELERDSMFLVPLDSERVWFRYHHLFGDWLKHTLSRGENDAITALHRRAGSWFESHNLLEQAINHTIAATEIERAAGLIDTYLVKLPYIYDVPVPAWLESIPDEESAQHPAIVVVLAFRAMRNGDTAATQRWVQVLSDVVSSERVDSKRRLLMSHGRMFRGVMEMFGGDPSVAAMEFRAIVDDYLGRTDLIGNLARGMLGIALYTTEGAESSVDLLRDGADIRRQLSISDGGITGILAAAYVELGMWDKAEAAVAEALAANPKVDDLVFPSRIGAHYAHAQILHRQGRTADAAAEMEVGLAEARAWPFPADAAWGYLIKSRIVSSPAAKRRALNEALRLGPRGRFVEQLAAAERRLTASPRKTSLAGVRVEDLTPRELDVLRLLRGELSLREISGELFVSYNTVKGYTKTIYQKLAVGSRQEAVKTAIEHGVM